MRDFSTNGFNETDETYWFHIVYRAPDGSLGTEKLSVTTAAFAIEAMPSDLEIISLQRGDTTTGWR